MSRSFALALTEMNRSRDSSQIFLLYVTHEDSSSFITQRIKSIGMKNYFMGCFASKISLGMFKAFFSISNDRILVEVSDFGQ